jgi:zinc finger CCCH domain-containing protein 13
MHVSLCTCAGREERKLKLHPSLIERNDCSSHLAGSDGLRREREDRERPRSRVRDSSRQRREPSPPRRERELDRERDRDDHRKRDARDRDVDRETNDDPRRWRDDGKREERLAARREVRDKEYREKERDREREREKERGSRVSERDPNWDSDRPRDRDRDRWVMDERDSRSKRTSGRDRRAHSRDEDRDERKDSRVRVEEKEPAWMDAYIPPESGAGILGGKAENGELDSIQAWKLDMKEKERKERESEALRSSGDTEPAGNTKVTEEQIVLPTEPPLDEIQLFKLMIKREEEKNKALSLKGSVTDPAVAYIGTDSGVSLACVAYTLFIASLRSSVCPAASNPGGSTGFWPYPDTFDRSFDVLNCPINQTVYTVYRVFKACRVSFLS